MAVSEYTKKEAATWSIERIKQEIDSLRERRREIQRQQRDEERRHQRTNYKFASADWYQGYDRDIWAVDEEIEYLKTLIDRRVRESKQRVNEQHGRIRQLEEEVTRLRGELAAVRSAKSVTKERGTIKWFNDEKGYGFIERKSIFIHRTAVRSGAAPKTGQVVEFEVVMGQKGLEAANVIICADAKA